jgi:phosphatidylglycerophosphate synthase
MVTIYALKPGFQGLLRPMVRRMAAAGVTANQVTVAAMLLSLGWGAVLAVAGATPIALLGLPVVLALRMAFNAADGMLAREHCQASRLGFFLNELGDIVSDAALYLPLMLALAPGAVLLAGATTAAIALTEAAGIAAQTNGGDRRYDGPFGKSDRAAYFSALATAAALTILPAWVPVAAIVAALVLSAVTVANRVRSGLRETHHG